MTLAMAHTLAEIMTGGQRIHEPAALLRRMRDAGVVPAGSLEEYMKAFEWGCPPHAGAGVGLERILMLMFKLGNIRFASMFPRDPRSLPEKVCRAYIVHLYASLTVCCRSCLRHRSSTPTATRRARRGSRSP